MKARELRPGVRLQVNRTEIVTVKRTQEAMNPIEDVPMIRVYREPDGKLVATYYHGDDVSAWEGD